jgi:hypothetical protein
VASKLQEHIPVFTQKPLTQADCTTEIHNYDAFLYVQTMEAQLGAEAAGEISFEVSSPGAERMLILPQDLLRFKVKGRGLGPCIYWTRQPRWELVDN